MYHYRIQKVFTSGTSILNIRTEKKTLIKLFSANLKSCHRRCSVKKGVLSNFSKFTEKPYQKRVSDKDVSCEFCKLLRNLLYGTRPNDCFCNSKSLLCLFWLSYSPSIMSYKICVIVLQCFCVKAFLSDSLIVCLMFSCLVSF